MLKRLMFNKKEKDLFYHEDDYLQVEIISKSNVFEQSKTLSDINYDFSEYGFSNIGFRKAKKKPTSSLNINVNEFKEYLKKYSLIKFNKTYSGYSSNSAPKENTISYGFEDYAILFDYKKEVVQNIWIVFSPKLKMPFPSYSNLSKALYLIGNKYDMILVDWNEERMINLKSKKDIENYLNEL